METKDEHPRNHMARRIPHMASRQKTSLQGALPKSICAVFQQDLRGLKQGNEFYFVYPNIFSLAKNICVLVCFKK